MIVKPLDKRLERQLLEYMNQDRIRHFWGIYDLQNVKENILTLIALSEGNISGYLMEINRRINHIRGIADCAFPLLKTADSNAPFFNIEPAHFDGVKKLYRHFRPADPVSKGKFTTFLSMKVTSKEFKPVKALNVRAVGEEDLEALSSLLSREPERTRELLKGPAYGMHEHRQLIAFAAAPDMVENLAIIRGVHTMPDFRGKGYATKVCSAVTAQIIDQGKEAFLYVSKDNLAALRVYRKLGFNETGHVFLSFSAERK